MTRRGRHRVKRTRRLTLRHVAALMAAIVAVVFVPSTANGEVHHTRATGQAYADYNDLGRWPDPSPTICVRDYTHGFPVAAATEEFAGVVDFRVSPMVNDTCHDDWFIVDVITIDSARADFTGWFNSGRSDAEIKAGEPFVHGLITVNTSRERDWFLVLVHELGHAAGLSHAKQCADSVMDPTTCKYGRVDGLTDADRQQLAEIYGGAR